MMIAMLKPRQDFFALKNIRKPLDNGWRVSKCGTVVISLANHYFCNNESIIETPQHVCIEGDTRYQLFGCYKDTYVYFYDARIFNGDLQHTLDVGVKSFKTMPSEMMTKMINNLNVAGIVECQEI